MAGAQDEELELIADLFRENPESFWKGNKRAKNYWNEAKLIQALNTVTLTPKSDPNIPSHIHRVMKSVALVELKQSPLGALLDDTEVLKRVLLAMREDAKGLLKAAIRDPNPVIFLENEILYGQSFDVPDDPDFVLPIGKAKIERPGKDVTIVAFSIMVGKALQAAEELAKHGIDAEVINLRSLRPFDTETIVASIKKTNRLVSVEEGWPFAGIGSELAAQMMDHAFDWLDAPVKRVAGLDLPLPYAANLEKMALPQSGNIVEAARAVCNR